MSVSSFSGGFPGERIVVCWSSRRVVARPPARPLSCSLPLSLYRSRRNSGMKTVNSVATWVTLIFPSPLLVLCRPHFVHPMDHLGGVPDPEGVGVLESDFPVPGGASLQGGRDKVVGWMGAVQTCTWQTRTDSIDRTPVLSRHTWSVFLSLFACLFLPLLLLLWFRPRRPLCLSLARNILCLFFSIFLAEPVFW